MRNRTTIAAFGLVASLVAVSAGADLRESRDLEESFPIAPGGRLVVDNIFGSVTVTGAAGREVTMKVVETIEADDPTALERARREVALLTSAEGGVVDLYVDGPFRDRDERGWRRKHERRRYRVIYDFTLEVPRDVALEISTVTEGEISIAGVHGDFDISNVNGGIEMTDLRGSGSIRTVNGPIHANFSRSPTETSGFETVNGKVEVYFPPDLSADLELDSRWGELWSEFDFVALPTQPETRTTRGGRTVIKMGGPVVRVAQGGPRLSFETLNGDVLIRKHDRGESK